MRQVLPFLVVLVALAGCGGEQVVSPAPETVVGSVPTETTGTTTAEPGGGTTTGDGGTTTGGGGGGTTTGGGGGGGDDGKALFAMNGCGSCHVYGPAGPEAAGKIGPPLDNLEQLAMKAKQPLEKFTRESIVTPDAYVEPGYQAIMPSFASLPSPQVETLVEFLTAK